MKVIDKIRKSESTNSCFWSFEFFPPKTTQGVQNLYDRLERMYSLGPTFVDVTWGAGGTTADLTLEICSVAQSVYGLETCMHLTCTNMPKEKVDHALKEAKEAGIQNILALRGDPPRGQENWTACEDGFSYAIDLVKYIRQQYGDYFGIAVAGYPEGHIDNPSKEEDLMHLKAKIDAGADYIVTQLFYDVDMFLEWVKKCRQVGINCPILPGIMPIQSYNGFKRMTSLCKTYVPQYIHDALEPIKDDDQAVKEYGVKLAVDMCNKMKEAGLLGFHFYTLNLEKSTRLILEGLQFVAPVDEARPLPWHPLPNNDDGLDQSLSKKREKETVRPIFWKNRTRSYVSRTESWDEFPNGRWGDARSPAYGELDGYGASLKQGRKECLELWGYPKNVDEICQLFVRYCRNELSTLPWSDQPLFPETEVIRDQLALMNSKGYLTINSQPAVDGVKSADLVFGWGPKNGWVYQKAYLEFFVSPAQLQKLVKRIEEDPHITYYAVNRQGDLMTNSQTDGPNAVTWGVFPGKEIVQPTIVEPLSFMAWKDEAFELWSQWGSVYEPSSPTSTVINDIYDNWYLMNIVHNDFHNPKAIFKIFEEMGDRQSSVGSTR
ncbi:methylenetetrahydrofolate reductase-domain-containing protein [Paraphysoderma sedebokerense]|nr:methylenetetrahydrofolate reductase-domain-containing protein [Paraphysoderma sedebokerense]